MVENLAGGVEVIKKLTIQTKQNGQGMEEGIYKCIHGTINCILPTQIKVTCWPDGLGLKCYAQNSHFIL